MGKIPEFKVFEGMDKEHILLDVISKKITHSLGTLDQKCLRYSIVDYFDLAQQTIPLSREASTVLKSTVSESNGRTPR